MPAGPRVPSRPGAGPGRGKPRARTRPVAPRGPSPTPEAAQDQEAAGSPPNSPASPGRSRRFDLTARALALAVVMLILVISYASSLRIYVAQVQDLTATRTAIAERQARIAELEGELGQWEDSSYVRAQARARLGWVVPGETGYTVVDADGKPLGGGADITADDTGPSAPPAAWYAKLWGSVAAADRPPQPRAPAQKEQPAITESTKPTSPPSRSR